MPPEKKVEVEAWLKKAETDLRAGRHDLLAEPALVEDVLFHAQQACEKALKAFLTFHDRPFTKTHDLEVLGELALKVDSSFKPEIEKISDLTPYAWTFRYPGESTAPSDSEAKEALEIATVFVVTIKKKIKI